MAVTRRTVVAGMTGGAALLAAPHVRGQQANTVRVGLIGSYSGPFATWGTQFRQGVELYMAQNGATVGGAAVEVITRDDGGPNPERARQHAQELLVRNRADVLAGVVFTPNALAIAPLATEAKKPFVIFNAATSVIVRRSPYIVRTSFQLWQTTSPIATWAARNGVREALICISDYGPGHDARDAFRTAFTAAGGTVKDIIAVPLNVVDFAPYVQRALDARPGAVFVFMPAGPTSIGFMKAFADLGGHRAGIKLIGPGDMTDEVELPAIGESALGVVTSFHYQETLDTPRNRAFVEAYRRQHGADSIPNFAAVAAYDGMHLIYEMIRRGEGRIDGDRAMEVARGIRIDSPRGPITIEAAERDVVQDIYIRRVERVGNKLLNVAFDKFEQVRDPWKALNPA